MNEGGKCCGTCKWAKPNPRTTKFVWCEFPLNKRSLPKSVHLSTMKSGEGTDCPCYEPKPQPEDE